MAQLKAFWASVPQAVKYFLRDAIEAAIAAIGSLVITLPANLPQAQQEATVVFVAVAAAVLAVARRELLPIILNLFSSTPAS